MGKVVNVHEAKTQLSKLLRRVEAGEDVVIGRGGQPIALLTRITPDEIEPRPLGTWRGKVEVSDDFDALPDEVLDAFYASRIEPDVD